MRSGKWLAICDSCRERLFLAAVHLADARGIGSIVQPSSIDAVITSHLIQRKGLYPNDAAGVSAAGLCQHQGGIKALKRGLIRSNTRGVYKGDDDDQWVAEHPEIQRIAEEIERRRIELGKTSGFERMYAKVTKLYFGGWRATWPI